MRFRQIRETGRKGCHGYWNAKQMDTCIRYGFATYDLQKCSLGKYYSHLKAFNGFVLGCSIYFHLKDA